MPLGAADIERFVHEGYLHLPAAFPREVAAACVDQLWKQSGLDRHRPETWTEPVLRVAGSAAPPIVAAINTDRLCHALDDLIGAGRWQRRTGYGTFPVRFPSERDPGDAGWHIDGSFEHGDQPPPWNLWVNFRSKQRALLVLMLYSDVGPDDAPTRIRVGSHSDVVRRLVEYGERGTSFVEASQCPPAEPRPVVAAIGEAGDAYLCHPFLLHAATWPHRGAQPRFVAQPCIQFAPPHDSYLYDRADGAYSVCERAVRRALAMDAA
jgi:hypothetical protein